MLDKEGKIIGVVRKIPRGKVATYGQVAALTGNPRAARYVGYVLHRLNPQTDIPWQRVVNRQGRISILHEQITAESQARRLQREGVIVFGNRDGYWVDLKTYLWQPDIIEVRK